MSSSELEKQISDIALNFSHCLSPEELTELSDLLRHDERGVAYEMLCVQLYEHECKMTRAVLDRLDALGETMNLSPRVFGLWDQSWG